MTSENSTTGFPDDIASAKKAHRLRLARLPIEEKLKILVRMQRIAADIAKANGRPVREPWVLED